MNDEPLAGDGTRLAYFYDSDCEWYSTFDRYLIIEHSAIPIPGAVWLLGSGLIGIVGIRRKFKK